MIQPIQHLWDSWALVFPYLLKPSFAACRKSSDSYHNDFSPIFFKNIWSRFPWKIRSVVMTLQVPFLQMAHPPQFTDDIRLCLLEYVAGGIDSLESILGLLICLKIPSLGTNPTLFFHNCLCCLSAVVATDLHNNRLLLYIYPVIRAGLEHASELISRSDFLVILPTCQKPDVLWPEAGLGSPPFLKSHSPFSIAIWIPIRFWSEESQFSFLGHYQRYAQWRQREEPSVRPTCAIFEQQVPWTEPQLHLRWSWAFCAVFS